MTYRVGGSWKTHTIILEGSEPGDENGKRPDDLPVAWVDSAAPEGFADLTCQLHNAAALACDCGHTGLDLMFHLPPCPVAVLRKAAGHRMIAKDVQVGDWVKITGRVVEKHPNWVDLGVEVFSKTDQYTAFVRADLCELTAKPLSDEPADTSIVFVQGRAYQRLGEWWQPAGELDELTWEQVNALGEVEVIHDA